MWKRLVAVGEEKLGQLATHLMSSETMLKRAQDLMQAALDAKSQVAHTARVALTLLNLPSLDDVHRLEEKLGEIEELFNAMRSRLDELERGGPRAGQSS